MMRLMLLLPLLVLVAPLRHAAADPPPVQYGQFVHTGLDDWLPGAVVEGCKSHSVPPKPSPNDPRSSSGRSMRCGS